MKLGSFNVRGLGSVVKKEEVRKLLVLNKLDFVCIQETKMEEFSGEIGKGIWGREGFCWCAENSSGRSGGILSFWDGNKFLRSSQ